ncbi:MAG: 3-oxoacyl-(acyl-carrier-protein) reductase FabG [bacterium ADurb.Bin478]|nr:MAG: 3-oxoacyl-(acyl-carrier-protein) reductase FabG [bacterium ADurb.Bin478]
MNRPVALVTGGARGIGRGIAENLAENGYDVVIDDVHENAQEALSALEKRGAKALYLRADITAAEERKRIIEEIKKTFGRLHLLVNNAGVAPLVRMDLLQATEESFDRVMKINLKGPYFLTQLVANWMIEQKAVHPDQMFRIVNISSNSAYTSSPSRGEYCLSKAGVSMMTKLYADRLAEHQINVFEIRPGIIMTDMTSTVKAKYDKLIDGGLLPLKRWGQPEDIGKAIVAIAKGLLDYSTGEVINVDGGFHLHRL